MKEEFPPQVDLSAYTLEMLDLDDDNIIVKGGEDLYVGYAVMGASSGFPFTSTKAGDNFYWGYFNLDANSVAWSKVGHYGLFMQAQVIEKQDAGDEPEITSLAQMGIPSIADPSCGDYAAGESFQLDLALPEGMDPAAEEVWLFDGAIVTGAKSVSLTAGHHMVNVRLKWPDGSQETLSLALDVK